MRQVSIIDGVAAIYVEKNVDTDQICPARFLHRPRAKGYAKMLFHDLRFDADGLERDFVLNHASYRDATILVAGDNFGCGSSREQAVWAIHDFGLEAVIAPKFGDIFRGNCVKNGVLPIALDLHSIRKVQEALARASRLSIDLPSQTISSDGMSVPFDIDAFSKARLVSGTTEIAETLTELTTIAAFEADYERRFPWMCTAEQRLSST